MSSEAPEIGIAGREPRELAGGEMLLDFPADAVARLTLNNPGKRNPLSHAVLDAIAATLPLLDHGIDVRCVLVTGAGKAFSAGYDIGSIPAESFEQDAGRIQAFLDHPNGWMIVLDLLGVAIAGGMFVVPLYAFLTTTVPKSETARTIAANNIVNSGLMVFATLILTGAVQLGVTVGDSLLIVAVGSIIAAWLGWKLHLACD